MNTNNEVKELFRKIFMVTNTIEIDFPLLYRYLNETPINFYSGSSNITIFELQQYLETLEVQLKTLEVSKKIY